MNRNLRKWMFFLLAAVVALVAGCQAVGDVDLNKTLISSLDAGSYQARGSLSMQVQLDPSALEELDDRDKALAVLFSDLQVNLTDIKVQDPNNMSAKGDFRFAKGSIPFHIVLSDQMLTIWPEGAKQPFRIDLLGLDEARSPELEAKVRELQQQLAEKSVDLQKQLLGFVVKHLPNPKNISVERVTLPINGESLRLNKVHAEIYASDLPGLAKTFLTGVAEDDEGLKALISSVYDYLVPIMLEFAPSDADGEYAMFLEDKEFAVNMGRMIIKKMLNDALADFDTEMAKMDKSLLTDDNYLKVDLYADDRLQIRKSGVELVINAGKTAGKPAGKPAIKISTDNEMWNVGKRVAIDKLPDTGYVIDSRTQSWEVLNNLDPKSLLYDVLKNDLQITRKEIMFLILEDGEVVTPDLDLFSQPYLQGEGTIMVPEEFVTGELNAVSSWNWETRQYAVVKRSTGDKIVFTVGETTAYVNGSPAVLEQAPEITDDTIYVPLRFLVETMGGRLEWNELDNSIKVIIED
jgi:hypothetical protein